MRLYFTHLGQNAVNEAAFLYHFFVREYGTNNIARIAVICVMRAVVWL